MHSGSSISPKHPAIPVSIGIASLVLEGRSSALDDSSINASATVCATSNVPIGGHGNGSGGGAGGGSSTGSGTAGGEDEEDGGFCGQRRTSESAVGASSLQQCSLMAMNESQKSLAMSCCHTPNETQRINLKLQQIRSSCPSTSKNEVQHLVTVSGEPNHLSSGRSHEREIYESFPNVVSQHDPVARPSLSSASSSASWFSNELPIADATAGVVIYSGFEKMNVLGTVSPIKNHPIGNSFINFSSSSPVSALPSSSVSAAQSRKPASGYTSSKQQTSSSPREGPHCEQFLKKIGLTKPDTADGPEHHCSYRNKYCLRWQVYFKQLSSILTNGEAVCIEVYLGPENHTILLEQWVLKLVMTKSPATMTLQSLCAAIRSQLYFSQISAWTDLIKKSLEPDIFTHPRIKKIIPAGAYKAGGGGYSLPQAKLDILFRIRTYDNTACFNEKPNVHNFPDASVAENFVIQVCLKSLPRLDRIPGIDAALDAAKMIACMQKQQQVDRIPLPCHEKGKHRCAYRVELEEEEDEYDPSMVEGTVEGDGDGGGEDSLLLTSAAISHREKQLLKYRKRMLKREKKKKSSSAGEVNSSGSATSSNSSSVGGSHPTSDRNGTSTDGSSYLSAKSYNGSLVGNNGLNVGSKNSTATSGALGFSNGGVSVIANDGCSNGACRNALTSSINSIQPPLYSSNDHHQAMMVCDDRFQPVATNSKSTQTTTVSFSADMLPPVVSVATQTDPTVIVASFCNDCNNRAQEANGGVTVSSQVRQGTEVSQNINHASSSISSTNRDRYRQYFNDYYRTYNIINENCDKDPAAPEGYAKQARNDVPMDEGSLSNVQKPRVNCDGVSSFELPNTTARRPCFIVGGDGYDGDEDDDSNTQKRNRAIDSPILQQGDLLLQAIQRTAMLNGSETYHSEKQDMAKNGHGHAALNNNNYTTANNNIVECVTVNDGSGGIHVANGMQQDQQMEAGRNEQDDRDSIKMAAKCESSECDTFSKEKKLDLGDCRLCKRQKTKHNFKLNLTTLLSTSLASTKGPSPVSSSSKKEMVKKNIITTTNVLDCGSTPPGCRRTLSESLVGHLTIPGSSSTASVSNEHSAARCEGNQEDNVHSLRGLNEGHDMLYPNGEDLSPSDSPMLSSSTGTVGNGVFTFEQMKSYRRAFSEDVIDTITTLGTRSYAINDRNQATEEDSTEDDGSNNGGDNESDHVFSKERSSHKTCGCAADRRSTNDEPSHVLGAAGKCGHQIAHRYRPHTSTPAAGNGNDCKEPLYISCSETDCSVSTASSVSPHKKQILSCTAIGNNSFGVTRLSSEANAVNRKEDCCSNVKQQQKSSSKINLNYVFCLSPLARDDSGFTSGSSPATSTTFPATSPISIDGGGTPSHCLKNGRNANGAFSTGLFRYDFEETPVSPVSGTIKSKSAPVFPFSPPSGGGALSPRFLRNAQRQFHHRTRYPSERSSFSERSSIGSDEQLSDDDLSSYLLDSSNGGSYCSPLSGHQQIPIEDGPVGSALKMGRYTARSTACLLPTAQMLSKVLNRNLFKFGRAPMLGTLEESLLQRRLAPKFQVADFKVLLGASGSFCPTQLTIPAASYFYELPGQHLTTPYVCELRLPRKGYSIPRTGTVQATLLNPLGTVVRMFVVPYDFRDMPAMSTTFIRQRILACDDSSLKLLGKNIEQLSNAEQMKLLRYAIHLRFQTSRSGKLSLHTDIRLLISRRTDCDTAAAHAKNLLESPNELKVVTIIPDSPKFSLRIDKQQ
uniref:Atos-like conserved domain-containing protein n=1 Tax=Anopheles culicifacies TaxID=139723 RepID=A0A182MDH3_9DIPT